VEEVSDVHPFLRIVVEKRDFEQLMDDDARLAELDGRIPRALCFVCEQPVSNMDPSEEKGLGSLRVCGNCGGRKRQRQLERNGFGELLERFGRRRERPKLELAPAPELTAAASSPTPETEVTDEDLDNVLERLSSPTPTVSEEVMSEERLCPHCSKKLRSDNTRGMCSNCFIKHGRKSVQADGESAAPAKKPKTRTKPSHPSGDVEKRFDLVVEVLGLEREEVLRGLMAEWLASLKGRLLGPGA
jgi:hypothetical protein